MIVCEQLFNKHANRLSSRMTAQREREKTFQGYQRTSLIYGRSLTLTFLHRSNWSLLVCWPFLAALMRYCCLSGSFDRNQIECRQRTQRKRERERKKEKKKDRMFAELILYANCFCISRRENAREKYPRYPSLPVNAFWFTLMFIVSGLVTYVFCFFCFSSGLHLEWHLIRLELCSLGRRE
jgi:hypothetical protein